MMRNPSELLALGLAVAQEVQSEYQRTSGTHPPVSGQVLGYLRWYGDLRKLPGYWPLARGIELLEKQMEGNTSRYDSLDRLIGGFAAERGCGSEAVLADMQAAVDRALELHPDFASQVLGGLACPHHRGLTCFLTESAGWLYNHILALYPVEGTAEAVWLPRIGLLRKEGPAYLSQEDVKLARRRGRGESCPQIAEDLGLSAEEVEERLRQVLTRARAIAALLKPDPVPPQAAVRALMKRLGIHPAMTGARELEAAVLMILETPDLLERLPDVYTALAKAHTLQPESIKRHISNLIKGAWRNSRLTGQCLEFYAAASDGGRSLPVKKFLYAFLRELQLQEPPAP